MKITIQARKLASLYDHRRLLEALGFRRAGLVMIAWIASEKTEAPALHYIQQLHIPAGHSPASTKP